MKKSRFTEIQIVSILKEVNASIPAREICDATHYKTNYNWSAFTGLMRVAS